MPRREPRWARERAEKAEQARAASRPEPRFGVSDDVPGPSGPASASGGTRAGSSTAAGAAAGSTAGAGRGDRTGRDEGPDEEAPRRRRWRLPLAMLVVGLLLGAGSVGALVVTGVLGTTVAAPAPEPAPSRVTVSVPESCTQAGRLAEQVGDITQEVVAATGELDAARLQVLVDQLQQLDPEVREATAACEQDSPTLSATNG